MSEQVAIGKLNANAASKGVLVKLLFFSLSLGIVPLTSYYMSLKYIYNGNPTFAAITAVVAANVVLVAYIITSLLEDKKEKERMKPEPETKKDR